MGALHRPQSRAVCFSVGDAIDEVGLTKSLWRACRLPACAFLACALGVLPASAHRSAPPTSTAGLAIPSVSHGQMAVLAAFRADIQDLAAAQYPTDPDMRRLQSFVSLQYFSCGWGLVPGSLSSEDSPFNECTHAYLAGLRALLLHLETMPGDRSAVRSVRGRVDVAMLRNRSSLSLCRYSDEAFNTADVVTPRLGELLTDPRTFAVLALLALCAALAGSAASQLARA